MVLRSHYHSTQFDTRSFFSGIWCWIESWKWVPVFLALRFDSPTEREMKKALLIITMLFCWGASSSSASASSPSDNYYSGKDRVKLILGDENLEPLKNGGILQASAKPPEATAENCSTLVLAAQRTHRPDILRGFRHYHGGWDISNHHYWASVGFTGSFAFILAILWLVAFGVALLVHHLCGCRVNIKDNNSKGSQQSQRICLTLLILFTCAAAIGCILLSVGQNNFHHEVLHTLEYVVNQSDYTVQTLRNVTDYLSLAKTVNVAQVFLPSDVMDDIDKMNVDLDAAADTLTQKTNENSVKIRIVFNAMRLALITVAAVTLVLALLGLMMSILGHRNAVLMFVVSGWLLVAVTFVLCGVFVIFNNAISDTCLAMEEWVENPHAESALSDILPCIDQSTTNRTLMKSKQVSNDMVSVVNQFIYTYANTYPSKDNNAAYYYNQSGPMMPPLCYPFDSLFQDRHCDPQEVSIANASLLWQNYTCDVSVESGLCLTEGRVTPKIYRQLVGAVNESYALEHYAPPLLSLQNCDFVRETFEEIASRYCSPLEHYLNMVNAGLGLISIGVLLCLLLWTFFYANRSQREMEEVFALLRLSSLPVRGCQCLNIRNGGGGDRSDDEPSNTNTVV